MRFDEMEESEIRFGKKQVLIIVGVILSLLCFISAGKLFENVRADELCVIQHPITGSLKWCVEPGLYWQGFGNVTKYNRSFTFWFSSHSDQGMKSDEAIKTRFYDGGHGNISGSIQVDLPLDTKNLTDIHIRFHGQDGVEQNLVRTIFEKSIYMSGPLMSSKESYAEKRPLLIYYIEDQALHGVYQTTTQDVRQKDPLTGTEKTVTLTKIIENQKAPGGMARQEESPLTVFGLRAYNMNINAINYDQTVEDQIKTQQEAIMAVQTAIANAKKAEQDAITVSERGKAEAARAKWEQEVEKAKAVTKAQQDFEVAEWNKRAAEQTKLQSILLGQGEAERKRLVMEADGQLQMRINAWLEAQKYYAENFGKQKWVPEISMGNSDKSGTNVASMIDLLMAKTAKDLNLDLNMVKGKK